jgi:hypothetical protein
MRCVKCGAVQRWSRLAWRDEIAGRRAYLNATRIAGYLSGRPLRWSDLKTDLHRLVRRKRRIDQKPDTRGGDTGGKVLSPSELQRYRIVPTAHRAVSD